MSRYLPSHTADYPIKRKQPGGLVLNKILLSLLLIGVPIQSLGAVWEAKIVRIQAENIGDNYNVLYLDADMSNSVCQKTAEKNRLTIINEAQMSTALAALMAGKTVKVREKSTCNGAGLSDINYIMIFSDK